MEQTSDVLDNNPAGGSQLSLSPNAIAFLKETRKWANFLSILGFIGVGLMVLFGLFAGTIFSAVASQMGSPVAGMPGFMGVFYIFIALLYFFPLLYLYKFASKMKIALNTGDNATLEASFENLKSHYKFIGILAVIMLGFYVLAALFGVIAGAAAF